MVLALQESNTETEALNFYVFGSPITLSPSPEIHNTGFRERGFPHKYYRFNCADTAKVVEELKSPTCGGGSVGIPHKEAVFREMDELSEAAQSIGAVNTVTKRDGKLFGDNTDWLGIKNQLEVRLPSPRPETLTCLLCGAGGAARAAAFALQQMGAKRALVYNRTTARAEALAREFGFEVCADLEQGLAKLTELHIVVSTLPGDTAFSLPPTARLSELRPVVLEAAYIPRRTALLQQALEAGCQVVEGVEMLFEQGCAQCEIWTGAAPPRRAIAQALIQALFHPGSGHPAQGKMEPHEMLPLTLAEEAFGPFQMPVEVQGPCLWPLPCSTMMLSRKWCTDSKSWPKLR